MGLQPILLPGSLRWLPHTRGDGPEGEPNEPDRHPTPPHACGDGPLMEVTMKFFRCTNDGCVRTRPGTATKNAVRATVTVAMEIDDDGVILDSPKDKIVSTGYVCGSCGDVVKEVHPDEFIRVDVDHRRDGGWLIGTMENDLRGSVYTFALHIPTKEIRIKEEREPWDVELESITAHCMDEYKDRAIEVDLTDIQDDGTFELEVKNFEDSVSIYVEATATTIVCESGPRPLNAMEKDRVLEVVREKEANF